MNSLGTGKPGCRTDAVQLSGYAFRGALVDPGPGEGKAAVAVDFGRGETNGKDGAAAGVALHIHAACVSLNNGPHEAEPEAEPAL